jgi:hypothetical protein
MRAFDFQVWQEIQYLEAPTRDCNCFIAPKSKPVVSGELEFLDDQMTVPRLRLARWAVGALAVCIGFMVLIVNGC